MVGRFPALSIASLTTGAPPGHPRYRVLGRSTGNCRPEPEAYLHFREKTPALVLLSCYANPGFNIAGLCVPARRRRSGARYIGGTIAAISANSDGLIRTTDDLFLEYRSKGRELHVEYNKINLIEYGQNVDRRYIMAALISPLFVLSKKRQHFLSLGYTDGEGRQQAMVFKVDKSKIRALLVSLEARTGLKVQFQDEQARKAGKG